MSEDEIKQTLKNLESKYVADFAREDAAAWAVEWEPFRKARVKEVMNMRRKHKNPWNDEYEEKDLKILKEQGMSEENIKEFLKKVKSWFKASVKRKDGGSNAWEETYSDKIAADLESRGLTVEQIKLCLKRWKAGSTTHKVYDSALAFALEYETMKSLIN